MSRVTECGATRLIHGLVKANPVLCELYRSVVRKRELSNIAKLSVFKSVCVPIPTNGHESWLMTERILPQVQAAKWDFRKEREVTQGRTEARWCSGQKEVWHPHVRT